MLVAGGAVGVRIVQNRLTGNVEHIGDPFAALPSRPAVPTPKATAEADSTPLNILVVGSDSRISAGDPSQWKAGAQRTDALMLVHLPADHKGAYAMSIPRDSWVDIPGHGMNKVNADFSYGGPPLLIQTIEQLTKVRIDHFAVADFDSFQAITDTLGGVEITLKKDLHNGHGTLLLPAGKHLMSGKDALVYVRERKSLTRGDFDRVQRQQAWMRSIFARMRNEQTLQDPRKSVPFLDTVTKSIAADDGLTREVMNDMILRAKNVGSTDLGFFTVPIAGTGTSPSGQSIANLNRPAFDELMAAVAADDVAGYLAAHPKDVDLLPPIAS